MATPKILNGKVVLQVYMLDNSYKTLLAEPTSTVHVGSLRPRITSERGDFCCCPHVIASRSDVLPYLNCARAVAAGRMPQHGREDRLFRPRGRLPVL
jgi:hypothetical protein